MITVATTQIITVKEGLDLGWSPLRRTSYSANQPATTREANQLLPRAAKPHGKPTSHFRGPRNHTGSYRE